MLQQSTYIISELKSKKSLWRGFPNKMYLLSFEFKVMLYLNFGTSTKWKTNKSKDKPSKVLQKCFVKTYLLKVCILISMDQFW